ncbi:unnamed protein product [Paramecium primaurelia]|uniref:Uncharacterized protein n=1 Tax=Paramecium primaurelia TaxID=5886 RepID=A0A8S1MZW5_PARPR|nr:unnamed protein product [Paramecium primaurelia]
MGCTQGKNKQKRASFQYEIYERAQENQIKKEIQYNVHKNPIIQRRVKTHSQTPDQQNRTNQQSDLLSNQRSQF